MHLHLLRLRLEPTQRRAIVANEVGTAMPAQRKNARCAPRMAGCPPQPSRARAGQTAQSARTSTRIGSLTARQACRRRPKNTRAEPIYSYGAKN